MKIIIFFLIKIPRKITRIIFYQLEYLYYRFLYSKPKLEIDCTLKRYLICGGIEQGYIGNMFRELFPDNAQHKITEANLICEHIFDLLGSNPKKLSSEGEGYQQIDWHSDFKSKYRWDQKVFFRNIPYGHIEGVDVKVPWELSRFQHLNTLGQAYLLTKDAKYSAEFANQIIDWIESNPVGFGVNWKCTMDVSIRAVNWLVASEYIFKEDNLPKDFLYKFYTSIYDHGKFIFHHLERSLSRFYTSMYEHGKFIQHLERSSQYTSNHYIADLAGLFFIAVYCPFFKESTKWLNFCIKELPKEMEKQVYEDGCDFEASTSYHRLVLEMFFYCSLLAERAGISLPKAYEDKLIKMFEVSLYYIKPNGFIPQIGDNDSGRLLIFARRPILEHKYLLTLASIYYEDSSFKLPKFSFDEEAFWVFGITGKNLYDELPPRTRPLASKFFPDAGWYIIRRNNDYCFISCGPNGQGGLGGHAHNDKLSFELMLDGQDIIVDPGTYVYTANPQERNKFRSTKYHNTIKFDGYEQNEIPEKDIFGLPDKVKIIEAELKKIDNSIVFQGEIQYADITHKRMVMLDKKTGNCQIQDNASCSKPLNDNLTFHLSPNLTCEDNGILIKSTKAKIASIEIRGHSLEKDEYDYSPEYGVKVKAESLTANISTMKDNQSVSTYIRRKL